MARVPITVPAGVEMQKAHQDSKLGDSRTPQHNVHCYGEKQEDGRIVVRYLGREWVVWADDVSEGHDPGCWELT